MSNKKGKDRKVVDEFDELAISYKKNKSTKQPASTITTSKNVSAINTDILDKFKKEKINFDEDDVSTSSSSEEEIKKKKKDKSKGKEKSKPKDKKKKIKSNSNFDNEYSNERERSTFSRPSTYGNYGNRIRNNNSSPSSFTMNYEPPMEMQPIQEVHSETVVETNPVLEPEPMTISQVYTDPVDNVNQEYRYHDSNVIRLSTSLNIIDYSRFPDSNEESYSLYLPDSYQTGKLIEVYNVSNLKLNYYVYSKNLIKHMDYSIIENDYHVYIIENTPKNIKFILNNDQWIYLF